MELARLLRHACTFTWQTRRRVPASSLAAIEREITAAENLHSGEICVVIETAFDAPMLWRGITPRERAIDLFGRRRLWDTELNNAVLIYVLMADHDVEIVADRGFNGRVSAAEWETVCRQMEAEFRSGRYADAVIAGVRATTTLIARHFPPGAQDRNELPDSPIVL
jgi:uncharacterized membrane protein YgcG